MSGNATFSARRAESLLTAIGAQQPADTTITRQAWLALAVTTIVTFLVVIDISAVNVAFPSIEDDLETDRATLSWIISGYNIAVGALLLAAGRVADSIGRKRVFLPGVLLFMIGSAFCGVADSVLFLVLARIVQGVGGAVVAATSFAVMLPEFPPARRSTAIGIAGATGALGAVVGPALGSVLIELFSWRAIFLINVPLSLVVLVISPRLLRESKDPAASGKIDGWGVVIGTLAVGLMMFGIIQSETWGLADPRIWAFVIVGAALFPILVRRSRHHPEPLLDLELFEFRSFASANAGVAFYGFAFTSGALINSIVLQDLWQQDLSVVGLAFVPGPLLAAVISPLTGSLADRVGHRWVLAAGCVLCAVGYGSLLLFIGSEPAVWSTFVPLSLISGVGIGLTVATWSSAGLSDIPPAKFGVAGATTNTVRQAAYALGLSVTIALLATGADEFDLSAYQFAWAFVAAMYTVAGLVVFMTFPGGNSQDRAV